MSVQRRNQDLVKLLRADFLHLTDPARTLTSTANVSDPPTSAELTSIWDTPANLPDGFIGLVNDNGAGTDIWIAVVINSAWYTIKMGSASGVSTSISSPLTAFGELQIARLTPIVQLDFSYNINTNIVEIITTGSGTVTQSNNSALLQTTAASSSSATLESLKPVRYRLGQGVLIRS